ncbi:MAG: hypothetical protein HYS05_04625, partial [Acidobacteria bacterium]|nr:hypothetical protein [Acidobacteriota bacterium]
MPASRCPSASLLLVVSLLATRAAAQPSPGSSPERTFQPWVVFSANAPASGGLLTSTYSPPFDTGAFQSTASQTLTLDPATARGFEAGADYFVTPGVGVRALVSYSRAAFSGENGPYAVTLLYTSMQPPDFVPRQFLYQRETPWPATEGAFRQLNISVGGVGRWHSTRGFGATAYAGLGYLRMSGETQSIAYTSFHLGGHSVLFPEEYRLSASLGPS